MEIAEQIRKGNGQKDSDEDLAWRECRWKAPEHALVKGIRPSSSRIPKKRQATLARRWT
jgi:hypothetical protein